MGAAGSVTAQTDINVVNTALTRLGQSPIAAFGQNTGTGLVMQESYNASRDDLLRRQPWNFARTWKNLSQLSNSPLNLDIIPIASGPGIIQFTAAYQLPNDCLRVFRFSPKDAHWRIVGKVLYSDAIPATLVGTPLGLQPLGSDGTDNQPTLASSGAPSMLGIEYIRQITDPHQWDACFYTAFIYKLMKELAIGFTGLAQAYKMAKDEFDEAMLNASVINGMENWPDPFWNTDLNDVRYGYVGVTIEGF